jgi:alpha-D-xyloside xylohydrolase
MLVREGVIIPHMQTVESTSQLDWSKLEVVVYAAGAQNAQGLVCLPSDNVLHKVDVYRTDRSIRGRDEMGKLEHALPG